MPAFAGTAQSRSEAVGWGGVSSPPLRIPPRDVAPTLRPVVRRCCFRRDQRPPMLGAAATVPTRYDGHVFGGLPDVAHAELSGCDRHTAELPLWPCLTSSTVSV